MMSEFWIGFALGVASILATLGVAAFQERAPHLSLKFQVPDGTPSILDCEITNEGRGQATDVFFAFSHFLPIATEIFAAPEIGAQLVESQNPPDPNMEPAASALQQAFAIRIPRIAAKDTIRLQIRTTDPDNERAARQLMRIRSEIEGIFHDFGARLRTTYPLWGRQWDTESLISGQIKRNCFFSPLLISYERGREKVSIFSESEELAQARLQDTLARFKSEFIDVFQNGKEFVAPVLRIKTSKGPSTMAIMPPHVQTYINVSVPVSALVEQGSLWLQPPIPDSYD